MIKKIIPNVITSLRIIGAVLLFFVEPLGVPFYIIYSFCGLTDAVDGFVARKLNVATEFGAKLDSVSDLLFYIVMIVRLLPVLMKVLPGWIWYFALLVVIIRITSYVVSAVKYKKFASIHTFLNKATGFLVFIVPYLIFTPIFFAYSVFVCAVGLIASAQELLFHIKTQ